MHRFSKATSISISIFLTLVSSIHSCNTRNLLKIKSVFYTRFHSFLLQRFIKFRGAKHKNIIPGKLKKLNHKELKSFTPNLLLIENDGCLKRDNF